MFMYVLVAPFVLIAEAELALYSLVDQACTVSALVLPAALALTGAQRALVWPGPVPRLGGAALRRWAALGAPGSGWAELGVAGAAVKLGALLAPPPTRTLPPPSRFWRWLQEAEDTEDTAARPQKARA
jgi:hypothetical protein